MNDDIPIDGRRRPTMGPGEVPPEILRDAAGLLTARRAIRDEQDRLELHLDELRAIARRAGNRGDVAVVADLGTGGVDTIERYVATARELETQIEAIRRAGSKGDL